MNDSYDETSVMEGSSDNSGDMHDNISDSDNITDNQEQEEQEQEELDQEQIVLSDIYDELVDVHADILVLNDSVNNVALCVEQFANVTV